jgi:hypothetical protein
MGVAIECFTEAAAWQIQVTGMAGIVDVIITSPSKQVDTALEEHKASEDVLTVEIHVFLSLSKILNVTKDEYYDKN